jgi:hypothetical protein
MPSRHIDVQVIAEPLGGSPLSQLAQVNHDAPWLMRRPVTPAEWRTWVDQVRHSAPGWRDTLAEAFDAQGPARARLDRVAAAGGVVVTTGQQPGLFGGALTWNKAIAALELADAIERITGVPAAPVFWAATDDADYGRRVSHLGPPMA